MIGINNTPYFVRTNFYDDEFIMADLREDMSFVEGNYSNEVAIVLDSVFNDNPKTLLIQVKNINAPINHINKHTIKIHNQFMCN